MKGFLFSILTIACSLGLVPVSSLAGVVSSYRGIFVVVDPYSTNDMLFLQCSAGAISGSQCNNLAASRSVFNNPFIHAEVNGILLRLPWCGFQTGAAKTEPPANPGTPPGTNGECHYRLQGSQGTGTYLAGAFTSNAGKQFTGQSKVDVAINNLSLCKGAFDKCGSSVLGQALSYIATIKTLTQAPLSLSIALEAGQYTPQSVMSAPGIGFVDFPQLDAIGGGQTMTYCSRQPQAWQTKYVQDYTDTLAQVDTYLKSFGTKLPTVTILKEGALTSNSIEFDVSAHKVIYQTAFDPSSAPPYGAGNGTGPQGDAVVQCPDHTSLMTGVGALLNQYSATGIPGQTMANAYESAFGYVIGFEAGLLAQGIGTNSVVSVPTKGQQDFAHVDCGTDGNSTCIVDPDIVDPAGSPGQSAWSVYYFTKFVNDLFESGAVAYTGAAQGYASACVGRSCAPASFAMTPWQLSLVFTGIETPPAVSYTAQQTCWLNNTNAANAAATAILTLYTSATSSVVETVIGPPGVAPAPGGGTMLGWQTATQLGASCYGASPSYLTTLQSGIDNGGQFLEIETDAAAEPSCQTALQTVLPELTVGNAQVSCFYSSGLLRKQAGGSALAKNS